MSRFRPRVRPYKVCIDCRRRVLRGAETHFQFCMTCSETTVANIMQLQLVMNYRREMHEAQS